jgi:hypothetical protein
MPRCRTWFPPHSAPIEADSPRQPMLIVDAGRRRAHARAVCAGVERLLSDDSRPAFFLALHFPESL